MKRKFNDSVFLLPVMLIMAFLGFQVLGKGLDEQSAAMDLNYRMVKLDRIGDVVHELQRERGYSSGYLASGGGNLRLEMIEQRQRTDAVIDQFRDTLDPGGTGERGRIDAAIASGLDDIASWRSQVDARTITQPEVVAHYTGLVRNLLNAAHVTPESMTSQHHLSFLNSALQAVSLAKEAAGLQRAMGAAILGGSDFNADLHRLFVTRGAQQNGFLDQAEVYMIASEVDDPIVEGPVFDRVSDMQRAIIGSGYGARMPAALSPEEWFIASTDWIDDLREVEQQLTARINDLTTYAAGEARASAYTNGMAVILALMLMAMHLIVPDKPLRQSRPTYGPLAGKNATTGTVYRAASHDP